MFQVKGFLVALGLFVPTFGGLAIFMIVNSSPAPVAPMSGSQASASPTAPLTQASDPASSEGSAPSATDPTDPVAPATPSPEVRVTRVNAPPPQASKSTTEEGDLDDPPQGTVEQGQPQPQPQPQGQAQAPAHTEGPAGTAPKQGQGSGIGQGTAALRAQPPPQAAPDQGGQLPPRGSEPTQGQPSAPSAPLAPSAQGQPSQDQGDVRGPNAPLDDPPGPTSEPLGSAEGSQPSSPGQAPASPQDQGSEPTQGSPSQAPIGSPSPSIQAQGTVSNVPADPQAATTPQIELRAVENALWKTKPQNPNDQKAWMKRFEDEVNLVYLASLQQKNPKADPASLLPQPVRVHPQKQNGLLTLTGYIDQNGTPGYQPGSDPLIFSFRQTQPYQPQTKKIAYELSDGNGFQWRQPHQPFDLSVYSATPPAVNFFVSPAWSQPWYRPSFVWHTRPLWWRNPHFQHRYRFHVASYHGYRGFYVRHYHKRNRFHYGRSFHGKGHFRGKHFHRGRGHGWKIHGRGHRGYRGGWGRGGYRGGYRGGWGRGGHRGGK